MAVTEPNRLYDQPKVKRMVLMQDDLAEYEADNWAFVRRSVEGRIDKIVTETTPDGLTSLTIDYTPLLPPEGQ